MVNCHVFRFWNTAFFFTIGEPFFKPAKTYFKVRIDRGGVVVARSVPGTCQGEGSCRITSSVWRWWNRILLAARSKSSGEAASEIRSCQN